MKSTMVFAVVLIAMLGGAARADGAVDEDTNSSQSTSSMPAGHPIQMPEGLNVELREIESLDCAYLEGTLFGDMDALFGELYQVAGEQGLLTDDTQWGSAYPDDMSRGVDETTRVFAGITITPDAEVAEPLKRGTLPGGTYMMVQHRGDYKQLGDTYTAVYTWAAENGITFGTPSFEHYVTDPESTPMEDWLTEIYFPFDHEALKAGYSEEEEASTAEPHPASE
jgi:effector-binding domain-containing protein